MPTTASVRSGRKAHHRRLGQLGMDVGVAGPARAGQLDDELCRKLCRLLGEIRVDALLPAVRALGAESQALRVRKVVYGSKFAASSRIVRRVRADLRLLAAHDPRERDRALTVGDHQVVRLELAFDAVERTQTFSVVCAPHDDLSAR